MERCGGVETVWELSTAFISNAVSERDERRQKKRERSLSQLSFLTKDYS